LEFTGQGRYQEVGFGREIAIQGAHGDAYLFGHRPHLDGLVPAGGRGQRRIEDCLAPTR